MKTVRGIYINLKESEYKINYNGLIFYFSSRLYMVKFINNVANFVSQENAKINIKYKINISLDLYFTIVYYSKVEKRGFYIYDSISKKEITNHVTLVNNIINY